MMDLYVRATIVIVLFGVVKTQTGKYLSNIKILDCFINEIFSKIQLNITLLNF